jgi:hypothetical protein
MKAANPSVRPQTREMRPVNSDSRSPSVSPAVFDEQLDTRGVSASRTVPLPIHDVEEVAR